jgi:uncharacterized protein with von Willebrand factor type A (vWA) domain
MRKIDRGPMQKQFNREKAIEALLFVADQESDLYTALKAIYIADKEHLKKFGRTMFNETYCALPKGPVPSNLYDYIKDVRGDGVRKFSPELHNQLSQTFTASIRSIHGKRKANELYLSKSEIECLQLGIKVLHGKSFQEVKDLTHDNAFNKSPKNGKMNLEDIIEQLPNSKNLLEYVKEKSSLK